MFNIKNIVSKITERGKESQPNSPARMGQDDDDKLSKQGAEGFLCPKCMMALPTPEELQAHYETSHDSDKDQDSPDPSTSSSGAGAGFLGLHQEVGERYSRNRQDGNLISEEKLIAEVHGITEISELHKSLMDALASKSQLQFEKEQLEHMTAELAQANASLKAHYDEEQAKQTALNERLKIVETQLAHRENIDDAAVLRQELIQVQRVMDKMTREREGERDDLQSERDELLSKVNELTEQLASMAKSKNDEQLYQEELEHTQTFQAQEKNENILLHKKIETLEDALKQKKLQVADLRTEVASLVSQRDALNMKFMDIQHKELQEIDKVAAAEEEDRIASNRKQRLADEDAQFRTIAVLDSSDNINAGTSADTKGSLDKEELFDAANRIMNAEDLQKKVEELTLQLKMECRNSECKQHKIDQLEGSIQSLTDNLSEAQDQLKESKVEFLNAENHARRGHEIVINQLLSDHEERKLVLVDMDVENEKLKAHIDNMDEENEKLKAQLDKMDEAKLTAQLDDMNEEYVKLKAHLDNMTEENVKLKVQKGNMNEENVELKAQLDNMNEENVKLKAEMDKLDQSLIDSQSNLTACTLELAQSRTKLTNIEQSNFELHKSIAEAYLTLERMKDDTSVRLAELSAVNHDMESRMCLAQQEMSRCIYEHEDELQDLKTIHENKLTEYEQQLVSLNQIRCQFMVENGELKKKMKELEDKLQEKEKAVDQCKQEIENMELKCKAALSKLETSTACNNEAQNIAITKLQASLDEITGEKLALEALLETSQTEQKSLLEKFYQSCNDNESQRHTVDDVRRRLEDSQSALHELARENQILQLELEKLLGRKWTEDADAAQCKLCSKEFSIIVRKHHCRNCGQIFCSDCSNKMAPLANNKKPVRVCDSCYNELASK